MTGLVGFVGSSALCGLSPSVGWLIAARALQSISAAMLFANSPAILTGTFPGKQRGQALGLQALMTYLGLTTGPSLGGLLAQHVGWRSVFYINVPVGAVALFLSGRFIARDAPQRNRPPFDTAGAVLFFLGLLALLVALNQGHAWGWTLPGVLALVLPPAAAGMAVLACGLFFLSRVGEDTPLVQLEIILAVCGLGTGTFIAPNNSGLMGAAPADKQGIAAGVLATARNAGMVLGVGLSGAILTTILHHRGGSAVLPAVGAG